MFKKIPILLISGLTSVGTISTSSQNNDIKPFQVSPFSATHYTSDIHSQDFSDPFFYINQYNTSHQTPNPWTKNRYEVIYQFNNEYEKPNEAFINRPHPKYSEEKRFYHATISKIWSSQPPKDDLWIHENIHAQKLPEEQNRLINFLKSHQFLKSQSTRVFNNIVQPFNNIVQPYHSIPVELEPKWESFIAPIELIDNHPVSPKRSYCLPEISYTTTGYMHNNLLLDIYDRGSFFGKVNAINLNLLYDADCIDNFINPNRINDLNIVFFYRTGNREHNSLFHQMPIKLLIQPTANNPVQIDINQYDKENCGVINSSNSNEEFVLKTISDNMNDLSVKYDLIQRFIDPVCQLAYSFSKRTIDKVYDHYIFKPNQFGDHIDYDMLIAYEDKTIKISAKNNKFTLNKRIDVNGNIYESHNQEIFYLPRSFNKNVAIKIKLISTRTFLPFEKIISFNAKYEGDQ